MRIHHQFFVVFATVMVASWLFVITQGTPATSRAVTPSTAGRAIVRTPLLSVLPPRRTDNSGNVAEPTTSYLNLPISFEVNEGQTDPQVKFVSRGRGYSLFLTPRESVLMLSSARSTRPAHDKAIDYNAVLHMQLVAANRAPTIDPEGELSGKSNYFIGNDPTKWHIGVPNYARVRYREVYPGIDLAYHGDRRKLEYDFIVSPGADPKVIQIQFKGSSARLDRSGRLILQAGDREVKWQKPFFFQQSGGLRREIGGSYVIRNGNQIGFKVDSYDRSKVLVIDPVLLYSTYLGGSDIDSVDGIAVDTAHNVYFSASTYSANFPTRDNSSAAGGQDIVVGKINPLGTALIYSTYIGGSGFDASLGIAVDQAGNVYLGAMTNSANFPITMATAYQALLGGGTCDTITCTDAALVKINSTGSALLYSTYFGGNGDDRGTAVQLDSAGHAYLSGYTRSANFPVTQGAYQTVFGGGTCSGTISYPCADAFVAKFDTSRSGAASLLFSTYLGGSGDDNSLIFNGAPNSGLAVDAVGNAYLCGQTSSTDFPVTSSGYQLTYGGGKSDAYVSELDSTGSTLLYSTYLGGSHGDAGRGIALDSLGHVYATGWTNSATFPTSPGSYQPSFVGPGGNFNAWVAKLDPTKSGPASLLYSTLAGGPADVQSEAIAVDAGGNAYITGAVDTTDLPLINPVQSSYGGGVEDSFVSQLDSTGSILVFSTYLGGNGDDFGGHLAVDNNGAVYVGGGTSSTDFVTTEGALQTTYGGGDSDGFMVKIAAPRVKLTMTQPTPPGVTTVFDFGPFNFKSTPAGTTHSGNSLTITAIPVDPSVFNPAGGPFPTAQCFVYDGTGGRCIELDVNCSGPDCGGTYDSEFATSFDFLGSFVGKPGFLKVKDKTCSPTIFGDPTTTNQITAFTVQRLDPTTKGRSGGSGSCWVAVQGLTYPATDLSIVKVANPWVKSGHNLTYGIVVLNLGPNLATGVSVTDAIPIPGSMTLVSSALCVTGTSGLTCTTNNSVIPPCTVGANVVTCQVGNLLPFSLKTLAGAGIQLTFKVNSSVPSGTKIRNTATVQAFNPDPGTNNNSSTAVTKVQ